MRRFEQFKNIWFDRAKKQSCMRQLANYNLVKHFAQTSSTTRSIAQMSLHFWERLGIMNVPLGAGEGLTIMI